MGDNVTAPFGNLELSFFFELIAFVTKGSKNVVFAPHVIPWGLVCGSKSRIVSSSKVTKMSAREARRKN